MTSNSNNEQTQSQRSKYTRLLVIAIIALATAAVVFGLWSTRKANSLPANKAALDQPSSAPSESAAHATPSPASQATPSNAPNPVTFNEDPSLSEWRPIEITPSDPVTFSATEEQARQQEVAARPDFERSKQDFGPFQIKGHSFTVGVSQICMKESHPDKDCKVESLRVLDENGNQSYGEEFWPAFEPHFMGTEVHARLFANKEHGILALVYEDGPYGSFRFLTMRDGSLKLLTPKRVPYDDEGSFLKTSLLSGDIVKFVESDTRCFHSYRELRVNWEDFRLEEKTSGDFEVAEEPAIVKHKSTVQVFASADESAPHSSVTLRARAKVEFLGMRIQRDAPRWLKVRINGKDGWIIPDDDFYKAVGTDIEYCECVLHHPHPCD